MASYFASNTCYAQFGTQTLNITRKRPPQLDLTNYQKIAIGDFVGATGGRTTKSMDLADAITSKLFNSGSFEIIDRNALYELLGSQRGSEIKTITESTTASLSRKINSAVIILGRIQDEKVTKEEKSQRNIIVVNGCGYNYWWHITGNITAQIKILDVKTGKMLYSNPVSQVVDFNTKSECTPYRLSDDVSDLLKETLDKLANKIMQIVVPYDEQLTIGFENQAVTVFKNPFKKLSAAISCFNANNPENGLSILKAYADDKSLKDNLKEKAMYNYGVGLFLAGQDDLGIEQIKQANAMGSPNATQMLELIESERIYRNKLQAFSDKLAARSLASTVPATQGSASTAASTSKPYKAAKPVKKKP